MERKDFTRKFYETSVFNDVKDDLKIRSTGRLRYYLMEHNLLDKVDIRNLYVKLVNYRIKTTGNSMYDMEYTGKEFGNYITNRYEDKLLRRKYYKEDL